jgi:hypothetical protein
MAQEAEAELSQQIVGEQLSGVTFVMNYLQLQFNPPPTVNAYTPVTVSSGDWSSAVGEDQFRNKICDQITKIVKSVVVRDEEAFRITFEDDSVISISLKPSDYLGPEAVDFRGRDNQWMVI